MADIDNLSQLDVTINLRKHFPLSLRSIFRRSLSWILVYFLFTAFLAYSLSILPEQSAMPGLNDYLIVGLSWLMVLSKVVIIGKLIYEVLYHMSYYYSIEKGHVVVSRGVFLKKRGTFSLDSITDMSLERDVLDFFLGLYDFNISTPSLESSNLLESPQGLLSIQGLSTKTAVRLQDALARAVYEVHPNLKIETRRRSPRFPGTKRAIG